MNKIIFFTRAYTLSAGRFIFSFFSNGEECIVCGKRTPIMALCNSCKERFFAVDSIGEGVCRFCGKTLISENDVCMECRKGVLLKNIDGAFPLYSYRLWNTSLLCRWKMKGERVFSDFFAQMMNKRLSQLRAAKGEFVVVPVPPRPGKIKKIGWDQVEEVAQILQFKYNWNVKRCLKRESNVQQKTLLRNQRIEMSRKAYSLAKGVKVSCENVCLIDDVLTTGSTIETCSEILKKSGCKKVFAVALFSVDH